MPRSLTALIAKSFADELRTAREAAQRNVEDFDQIIHSVERFGSFLHGCVDCLGAYRPLICKEARKSPLAEEVPVLCPEFQTPFERLYDLVKDARNDAMHQGAFARRLTEHSIQLSLVLEDALRRGFEMSTVQEYMVRNPTCGELWHPLSFLRQTMLVNAFSYLPVNDGGRWCLISDLDVAAYLGQASSNNDRKRRLAEMLRDADGITYRDEKHRARCLPANTSLEQALRDFDGDPRPVLISREGVSPLEILGILAPADLL